MKRCELKPSRHSLAQPRFLFAATIHFLNVASGGQAHRGLCGTNRWVSLRIYAWLDAHAPGGLAPPERKFRKRRRRTKTIHHQVNLREAMPLRLHSRFNIACFCASFSELRLRMGNPAGGHRFTPSRIAFTPRVPGIKSDPKWDGADLLPHIPWNRVGVRHNQ